MNISLFMGIILIVAIISSLIKKYSSEFFIPFMIISICFIFLIFIPDLKNALTSFQNMFNLSKISNENQNIIFKIIGIYLISQFTSDICKDSGYTSLSNAVELFGKINIILVSMQMFKNFFDFILDIMSKV